MRKKTKSKTIDLSSVETIIRDHKKHKLKHIVLSMAELETLMKRPHKQSSPKLSTIASKVLKNLADVRPLQRLGYGLRVRDVKALAASVLGQDEKRGQ